MIADFDYSQGEHSEAVMVRLYWSSAGERCGRILVPAPLSEMLEAGGYPPHSDAMALEAALSYGVFIALKAGQPIQLTGDASVWKREWGTLKPLWRTRH